MTDAVTDEQTRSRPYSAAHLALLDREPVPASGVVTAEVAYTAGGTSCRGWVARPAGDGPFPAVLVVHDWLGVTDYVKVRAEMLARRGYLAFCADVYGEDTRPTPEEAPAVAGRYYGDQLLWRERLAGAHDAMLALDGADPARAAAIGYCFGGSSVLQLARTGADLRLVVSFHGGLQPGTAAEAAAVRARLVVLTGAADPVVPDAAVVAFEDWLRGAPAVDWEVTSYAGAMHAFTLPEADEPEHGAQFHERAERRSWTVLTAALDEAFGGTPGAVG